MSGLDALLGNVYNAGTKLELRGGLNFVGFTIAPLSDTTGRPIAWTITAPDGGAFDGSYDPATPAAWETPPTTVSGALDELAVRAPLGTPSTGDVPMWDGAAYVPTPNGGISITSFVASPSIVEVGQTTTPSFTAAYNVTPTTAVLTDNDGGTPKDVHATPTFFTAAGAHTKNTFGASVVFTDTATKGASSTSRNATTTWGQRTYWGVGAAGLTTAAFLGASPSSQVTIARAVTFTVSPSAQKVYIAIRTGYGAPTIKDVATGLGFATSKTHSADPFANTFSFTENYDLWESDFPLTGTFTIAIT